MPLPSTMSSEGTFSTLNESMANALCSEKKTANENHQPAESKTTEQQIRIQQQPSLSPMERMLHGEDVGSSILSFLDLDSIQSFALCSRTCRFMSDHDTLWRTLFCRCWNALPDQHAYANEPGFWKRCFINAHSHEQDLWVTHWNCVYPDSDGAALQPGRCCIPDGPLCFPKTVDVSNKVIQEHQFHRLCPTCRYHPGLPYGSMQIDEALQDELTYQQQKTSANVAVDPIVRVSEHMLRSVQNENDAAETSSTTLAKLIYYSTQYSIAKWCRSIFQLCNNTENLKPRTLFTTFDQQQLQERALRAFASSAANGRIICNVDQYRSSGLNFLTDLVFFRTGGQMIEAKDQKKELIKDAFGSSSSHTNTEFGGPTVSSFGPTAEFATHSCHVAKLTNPHQIRPILFRVYIQRCGAIQHQCFTAYPEQGLIQPGHTVLINFCVRASGALLNAVHEEIDVYGEEADPKSPSFCSSVSQLPSKPFIIRYLFAPPVPLLPRGYDPRRATVSISDHIWDSAQPKAIRTVYLAAHVNTRYQFESFQRDTLFPFELYPTVLHNQPDANNACKTKGCRQLTCLSTAAQHGRASEFNTFIDLEMSPVGRHEGDRYRTEKRCVVCGRDWGTSSERLGRVYLLRRLELEADFMLRKQKLVSLTHFANVIVNLVESEFKQHIKAVKVGTNADVDPVIEGNNFLRHARMYTWMFRLYSDLRVELSRRFSVTDDKQHAFSVLLRVAQACTDLQIIKEMALRRKTGACSSARLNDSASINALVGEITACRKGDSFQHVSFWHSEQKDAVNQNENSRAVCFGHGVVSSVRGALIMIASPATMASYGVFDRVSSPSSVTVPSGPSYVFARRSYVTPKFDSSRGAPFLADPDPEAMDLVLATIQGSVTAKHPHNDFTHLPDLSPWEVQTRRTGLESANPNMRHRFNNNRENLPVHHRQQRRRRGINLVWLVCSYLGWELNEKSAPLVDRKVLMAAQWLSNSFACVPLFFSLVARWIFWITPYPYDYYLDGEPPPGSGKSLRYLDCNQCACCALVVLAMWLLMGRHLRYSTIQKCRIATNVRHGLEECRNDSFEDAPWNHDKGSYWKILWSLLVLLFSFCSVAPHFLLNLLNIFFCGVAMGLSLSIETLEMGREIPSLRPFGLSSLMRVRWRHLWIASLLIGQIVGSSGGVFFLAEFIVTTISFLLGGVATISTSAVESWMCFATLSSTAFWGFIFARIGLLEGMKKTGRHTSSLLLKVSLGLATVTWVFYVLFYDWKAPRTVMVQRSYLPH